MNSYTSCDDTDDSDDTLSLLNKATTTTYTSIAKKAFENEMTEFDTDAYFYMKKNKSAQKETSRSILFNIDDSYKIIYNINANFNNIIKYHKIIYGNEIITKDLIFHPNIKKLYPTFLNEYNFFENDASDIDNTYENINTLSKALYSAEGFFKNISKEDNIQEPACLGTFLKQDPLECEPKFIPNSRGGRPISKTSNKVSGINITKHILFNSCIFNGIQYNEYYVLFNKHFLKTYFIKTELINTQDLKLYFPELNLLSVIKLENDNIETYEKICKNIIDEEVIIIKIKQLQNKGNNNFFIEGVSFEAIKSYLEATYNITSNIEDKIQFNTIYTRILEPNHITKDEDMSRLYKLLPMVLKELGLSKKRYSTGIFWYGLQMKKTKGFGYGIVDDIETVEVKYNKMIIERENLIIPSLDMTDENIIKQLKEMKEQWDKSNEEKNKQHLEKSLEYIKTNVNVDDSVYLPSY
jgi:hypothetical protein